jgi:NusB family.
MNGKPTGRRAVREWALRALYQVDLGGKPADEAVEEVLSVAALEPNDADAVRELVLGTTLHATDRVRPADSASTPAAGRLTAWQ